MLLWFPHALGLTELTKNFACEAEELNSIQIHTLIGKSRSFNTWIFVAILKLVVILYKELITNQQAKLLDFGESSWGSFKPWHDINWLKLRGRYCLLSYLLFWGCENANLCQQNIGPKYWFCSVCYFVVFLANRHWMSACLLVWTYVNIILTVCGFTRQLCHARETKFSLKKLTECKREFEREMHGYPRNVDACTPRCSQ